MNIYTEYLTFHTKRQREFINITEQVKAAMQKSGFHDGIILVSALHSNSAVFVNDEEPGLLEDIAVWLDRLAPAREDYKHKGRFESTSEVHLMSLLLGRSAIVGFSEGRLNLGPWEHVIYAELDGQRPKRALLKLIGE